MTRPIIAAVASVLLGVACATSSPAVGGERSAARRDSIAVVIDNENFYDANIFAEYQGLAPRRLGQVSGFSRDTFVLPWRNARLRMRSRLVGAGQLVSNDLVVTPGDLVELIILPQAFRRARD